MVRRDDLGGLAFPLVVLGGRENLDWYVKHG